MTQALFFVHSAAVTASGVCPVRRSALRRPSVLCAAVPDFLRAGRPGFRLGFCAALCASLLPCAVPAVIPAPRVACCRFWRSGCHRARHVRRVKKTAAPSLPSGPGQAVTGPGATDLADRSERATGQRIWAGSLPGTGPRAADQHRQTVRTWAQCSRPGQADGPGQAGPGGSYFVAFLHRRKILPG